MAIYIYKQYNDGTAWRRLFWNTDTKQANQNTAGILPVLEYSDNTIVDVYQEGNSVSMVVYNSTLNGLETPYSSYPRLFLNKTTVVGVGGDLNNTLLYKRCNTGDSPPTFEFAVYSRTTKDVKTFIYPLSQAPFCSAYAINESVILSQECIGTTLRRRYYDGDSGVTVEDSPNSAVCGYVAPVPDVVVTEVKRIRIDRTCYNNPYYLVWRNTLGGWDHWLFYNNQKEGLITNDLGSFINEPETNLQNSVGSTKSLGKTADNSIILGSDNLTTNQKDAIKQLLFSPMVYKVETDGSKKIVRVKPGSFSFEKKSERHSVEFEIYPPETFTVKS